MNILVTGANGQLGSEIQVLTKTSSHQFIFVDVEDMNLADEMAIRLYFKDKSFDLIINCAAYTAVDKAEEDRELTFKINFSAVKILTDLCFAKGIRLIHISTDYVFDGKGNTPLTELSPTNPLSVYGSSKLESEIYVMKHLKNAYILRTAWVYSTFGKNFVKTIATAAKERPTINVIYDQIGSPTYARDLATTVLTIVQNISSRNNDVPGLYHYSNEGAISWYDFACFIVTHYGFACKVRPIKTEQYKTLAVRPRFSLLDKSKIKEVLKIDVPHWHTSLTNCLHELNI